MAFQFDVILEGQALNTFGLTAYETIEGLGLNTFGFLWPSTGIWEPCITEDTVSTVWEECDAC